MTENFGESRDFPPPPGRPAKSGEAGFGGLAKIWLEVETEHCHWETQNLASQDFPPPPGRPSLKRRVLADWLKFGL